MELPRLVTPDVLWAGGCVSLELAGQQLHTHFTMSAIRGSKKCMLIDTGHPGHSVELEQALDAFYGDRQVDYIFISHAEFPHCGLATKWLKKYPSAICIGDVRDYPLYYPEYASRFQEFKAGDVIDLGDRKILFIPAIWSDLKDTIWAYDSKEKIIFAIDGFSIAHVHQPGTCGLFASEQPIPPADMIRLITEITLQWTKYIDPRVTYEAMDQLINALDPRYIVPSHGPVIDNPKQFLPIIKRGMLTTQPEPAAV